MSQEKEKTQEKIEITITAILNCLDEGKTRPEIAEYFGIPLTELREHFKHPKLKGKRAKSVPKMISVLIDDTLPEVLEEDLEVTSEIEVAVPEEIAPEGTEYHVGAVLATDSGEDFSANDVEDMPTKEEVSSEKESLDTTIHKVLEEDSQTDNPFKAIKESW